MYAAPIIRMSQKRASNKDRIAAETEHRVHAKAVVKIGLIMARREDLERSLHFLRDEKARPKAERAPK